MCSAQGTYFSKKTSPTGRPLRYRTKSSAILCDSSPLIQPIAKKSLQRLTSAGPSSSRVT